MTDPFRSPLPSPTPSPLKHLLPHFHHHHRVRNTTKTLLHHHHITKTSTPSLPPLGRISSHHRHHHPAPPPSHHQNTHVITLTTITTTTRHPSPLSLAPPAPAASALLASVCLMGGVVVLSAARSQQGAWAAAFVHLEGAEERVVDFYLLTGWKEGEGGGQSWGGGGGEGGALCLNANNTTFCTRHGPEATVAVGVCLVRWRWLEGEACFVCPPPFRPPLVRCPWARILRTSNCFSRPKTEISRILMYFFFYDLGAEALSNSSLDLRNYCR